MRNGSLFKYYNISSFIHDLNPLCKLLGLFMFLVMIVMCSSVRVLCGMSLILLYIMVISNISFKVFFKSLWFFRYVFLLLFLVNLLFGLSFYDNVIIVCRVCMIVLYFSILYYTTTFSEILFGFSSLLRPLSFFGFPVSRVSYFISLIFSFVPFLLFEFNRVNKSQLSRGYSSCIGFRDRVLVFFNTVVCSFLSVFRKIKGLNSMLNGFGSEIGFKWRVNDIYMIVCHLLVLVFVLIKEVVL